MKKHVLGLAIVLLSGVSLASESVPSLLGDKGNLDKELLGPIMATQPNVSFESGGNYGIHDCKQPIKPILPSMIAENSDAETVKSFNKSVRKYNAELDMFSKNVEDYRGCIETYVHKSEQYMNEIKGKAEAAIREINDFQVKINTKN